jgi:hypothetical protein
MLPPPQAPDASFDSTDNIDDDDDTGLPPAPLDVSAKQNLLFIEATTTFFSGKGGTPDAVAGLKKLEMWESILQDSGKPGLGKILQDFAVLREQLESTQPDGHIIAQAIASLADESQKVASATVDKKYEEPLNRLSEALLKMGSTLSK